MSLLPPGAFSMEQTSPVNFYDKLLLVAHLLGEGKLPTLAAVTVFHAVTELPLHLIFQTALQ